MAVISMALKALSCMLWAFYAGANAYHVSLHAHVAQSAPAPESSIMYTRVVADFAPCGSYDGRLAMCASKDFVCRMKDNQAAYASEPSCLPFDPNAQGANTLEAKATPPWEKCDPDHYDVNVPTCRLSFACMCQGGKMTTCRCVPPDSVKEQVEGDACGASKARCGGGEYCKWTEEGEQICSAKPYFTTRFHSAVPF
ncbi:hypothetical protein FI667_g3259, partial [Globisporangium splendens]